MKIEVLKSKITKIPVTVSLINNQGFIKMDKELMDELHIVEDEMVLVINERTGKNQKLFVEGLDYSDSYYSMMVPNTIAGVNEKVTVISTCTDTVDEINVSPIKINVEK
mgnify:CR=1 FL=1